MYYLDFLSESPNLFIFQKEANRTNFGGLLFLLYLVIIIIIFIYYIIDYIENDKYIIQSFYHFNIRSDEEIRERAQNILYNPNITFNLDIRVSNPSLDNKIKLFTRGPFINRRNTTFKERVGYFWVQIIYECDDFSCNDFNNYLRTGLRSYELKFEYDGFFLDHQNEDKPILKREDNNNYIFKDNYRLDLNSTSVLELHWRNIFYSEKKGFFKNDFYNDSCGYIENYDIHTTGKGYIISEDQNLRYFILSQIRFKIEDSFYTEYTRKKISIFDIIANVLSLVTNIFFGLNIFFKLYSKSFNNSKIIEQLLDKKFKPKPQKYKPLELNTIENTAKNIGSSQNVDPGKLVQDNDSENAKKNDDSSPKLNTEIGKLHFYDFFINNIYFCCKKKKSQNIINMCNKIVYKFASIDTIINNQILIENMFRDYKWNDPALNDIENNDLFLELKIHL